MTTIVTHNGIFHCDDAMATAILTSCFSVMGVSFDLVRTRDLTDLPDGCIVVDVGGEYDPSRGKFDHHQRGGALIDGQPMAAAGLIWHAYGRDLISNTTLLDEAGVNQVFTAVKEGLIDPIDTVDLGGKPKATNRNGEPVPLFTFSEFISSLNSENEADNFAEFVDAVELCRVALAQAIKRAVKSVEVKSVVDKLISEQAGSEVLTMEEFLPAMGLLDQETHGHIKWLVFPSGGTWRCQQTPWGAPLPEHLRGLPVEELRLMSGVGSATFVHPNGFIGGAATKEDAIKLSQL